MKNVGWLLLRWLVALPIGIAIGIGFQYLSIGLNWLVDHSIALVPLGGFQYAIAIPFRLSLAGGAAGSGPGWGIFATAIITPRFKQGLGVIAGLFLAWWYYGALILLFDGRQEFEDVFALLSSYIFPFLGILGSFFLLLAPGLSVQREEALSGLDGG